MTSCYNEIIVDICNSNIIIHNNNNNNIPGERESSLYQNSNPRPLTDGATDQTTELLMPTKNHELPLKSPRAGILRA